MATIKFFVRKPKKDKNKYCNLNIRLINGRNIDIVTSVKMEVPYKLWSNKEQRPKPQMVSEERKKITQTLIDLEYFIHKGLNRNENHINREWLKKKISEFHNQNQIKEAYLLDYIDRFICEAETGERNFLYKTSGRKQWKNYHPRTIQRYKTGLRERVKNYERERKRRLSFEDINLKFYNDFLSFLEKRYLTNTIGNTIKLLKKIMGAAEKEKLHSNPVYRDEEFVKPEEEIENIYLNENEIYRLYKLDLSQIEYQERIRDVFLVGCWTALRYGDYSRLNENNITKTGKGIKVIRIKTEKTGERVEIPIKYELDQILKKYNYNLPKTSEPIVNREIKSLARKAGITDNVRAVVKEKDNNGEILKIDKIVSKCTRITTHTARRSGATNMYKAGIPAISIMKVTGHRTEKSFMRYICIDKEENAELLSKNDYFRWNLRKIK